jgi:hypothetical protein
VITTDPSLQWLQLLIPIDSTQMDFAVPDATFECPAKAESTFALSELDSVDVEMSPAYLTRLAKVTEWTRRTMPHFRRQYALSPRLQAIPAAAREDS